MIPKEALEGLDRAIGGSLRHTRDAIATLALDSPPISPRSREPNARLRTGERVRVIGTAFYVESDEIHGAGCKWVAVEFGGKIRPVDVEEVEPL